MESLILSFNAVTPLFILMMLGYFLKIIGIVRKSDFDMINSLVFKIFLPVLLFNNMYSTTTIETFDVSIVLFASLGCLAVFLSGCIFVKLAIKENSKRSVMVQGFFRSNIAILGIPLIDSIFNGNVTGLTYLMVALSIPIFNVLAVLCFEVFSSKKGNISVASIIKNILKNPLIIGCVTGLLFFVLNIKLPFVVEKSLSDVSKIATPLSIIAIGGSFTFTSIKNCIKEVFISVFAKLIVVPLVAIAIAVTLGFRGEALACLLITFGGPVAISSFSMAQQMGGDEEVAANTVVFSSLFCVATLFGWIYVLSSMGLF